MHAVKMEKPLTRRFLEQRLPGWKIMRHLGKRKMYWGAVAAEVAILPPSGPEVIQEGSGSDMQQDSWRVTVAEPKGPEALAVHLLPDPLWRDQWQVGGYGHSKWDPGRCGVLAA